MVRKARGAMARWRESVDSRRLGDLVATCRLHPIGPDSQLASFCADNLFQIG